MTMKYDKMVAVTQEKSEQKIQLAIKTIAVMEKEEIKMSVAELVRRTGLSRGFFYKNQIVREKMLQVSQRQKQMHTNIEVSGVDGTGTKDLYTCFMQEKEMNGKLLKENQELKEHNLKLQDEIEKLNRRLGKKELSLLKKL